MAADALHPSQRSAIFLLADNFLAWTLYGILVVQIIRYASAIRSHPGRESAFQIGSVAVIFACRTAHTILTLTRVVAVYSDHFTDPEWVVDYRNNPQSPAGFFIGLFIISLVQLLFLHRALTFAKHLYPPGPMDRIRLAAVVSGSILFWTCFASGLASEVLRLRYRTQLDLLAAVEKKGTPAFLVLEVVWLASALVLMVVFSAASARDHLYAHRYNRESRLPATDQTTAILKEMLRVGATNSFLIVLSTSIYIFLMLYLKGTIAGRGCTALPAVYVCSLLVHIIQPRALRERQILEAAVSGADSSRRDSQLATKKRLFGFVSKRRRSARPSVGGEDHRLSLARFTRSPGIFSILVRDGPVVPGLPEPYALRRRRSSAPTDGVQKTIEVVSYSERVDGEDQVAGLHFPCFEEGWEARNTRLGIGNSVWVENRRSRRPLSVNDHSSPTQTQLSVGSDPEGRNSFATSFGGGISSLHNASPSRLAGRAPPPPPSVSPVAQLYLTSFPSGPVESQRHATYDPDLDLVDLPFLGPPLEAAARPSPPPQRPPPPAGPHVHFWGSV